jgi:uncharacterized protein YndB with AHSA1/START domain
MTEPMKMRVRIGAPLETVRHALTDAAELRVWLAEYAEVELPHHYQFWGRYTPLGDEPRQRPLYVDDTTLAFRWTVDGTATTVKIVLDQADGGTTLMLTQDGLPAYEEMVAQKSPATWIHTFWALSLSNLVDHCEGRPLTPKCDFTSTDFRAEVLIGASPWQVFESLVDPDVFAKWFGARMEIEQYIVDLEPGRVLSLVWPEGHAETWELEESQGKTRLTFVQSGFDEHNPPYGTWMGWLGGVSELRRYHELPGWRSKWLETYVEGIPDGLLTLD